jgi:hypothetical protein
MDSCSIEMGSHTEARWVHIPTECADCCCLSTETLLHSAVLQEQGICLHSGCAVAGVFETGQAQVRFGMVSDGCMNPVHIGVSLVAYCYREFAESNLGVPRMVQYLEPDPPYHMQALLPPPPCLELETAK